MSEFTPIWFLWIGFALLTAPMSDFVDSLDHNRYLAYDDETIRVSAYYYFAPCP